MKGQRIHYSTVELAWVQTNAKLPRADLHRLFVETFDRTDVSQENLHALCKRNRWLTGRTGHFPAGVPSWSAGKKGLRHKGSEKGWFKKGERRGVATRLYQPIGAERITRDGYIERKVNDDLPLRHRWRAVHLIRWEEANGPVPDGCALKCLDGNRRNTDPANWEAIPRAMLPRLSGRWHQAYDTAPDELKPTLMAVAKLEHAAREARKGKR